MAWPPQGGHFYLGGCFFPAPFREVPAPMPRAHCLRLPTRILRDRREPPGRSHSGVAVPFRRPGRTRRFLQPSLPYRFSTPHVGLYRHTPADASVPIRAGVRHGGPGRKLAADLRCRPCAAQKAREWQGRRRHACRTGSSTASLAAMSDAAGSPAGQGSARGIGGPRQHREKKAAGNAPRRLSQAETDRPLTWSFPSPSAWPPCWPALPRNGRTPW